jgi:hypothetical protein
MYPSFVIKPHQRCNGYMLTLSVVDRVFDPWSGQTKDNKIVIAASPLSTQH